MDPTLILFAISAGVKLGQKFYEVLVDANRERPLYLPLGDFAGNPELPDAVRFFQYSNTKKLTTKGGPYYLLDGQDLINAYHSVLAVSQQLGKTISFDPGPKDTYSPSYSVADEVVDFIMSFHGFNQDLLKQLPKKEQKIDLKQLPFDQLKKGEGHAPPVLRLIGVLVDIGIDYFHANPQALGENSAARKVLEAFITGIKPIDFDQAEDGKLQTIAGTVMLAGLCAFGENTNLVSKDKRIQVLLGGVTGAIVKDFKDAPTIGAAFRRQEFFERVTSSLLRGVMAGFADNPTLFLTEDTGNAEKIIRDTITQVFKGLAQEDQEKLFTNESLEVIIKSAMVAVSEDAGIVTKQPILQQLIAGTVAALATDKSGKEIFKNPEGAVAAILKNGLDALGNNIGTLIDPDNPERLFLVEAIKALTAGLGTTLSSGKLKDLMSTQQLVSLSQIVFNELAQHPQRLLGNGSTGPDPTMTALAQIVGSVGKALGENPEKLITGAGLLTLLQTAIRTTGQNVDKLLDLNTQDPATNLLYQVLQSLTDGFSQAQGPSVLFTREMFADTACRVIVTTSNNLGFVTGGKDEIPGLITKLMTLTAGEEIWNRLNSGNFPVVFEGLLRQVLLGKLNLDDAGAVMAAVVKILESS
jgi:hypothetical protein